MTLSNVKGPNEKAQMAEFVNCVVTLVHDSGTKDTINRVAQILNQNADKYSVGTSSYCDQFSEALAVNGGDGVEERRQLHWVQGAVPVGVEVSEKPLLDRERVRQRRQQAPQPHKQRQPPGAWCDATEHRAGARRVIDHTRQD